MSVILFCILCLKDLSVSNKLHQQNNEQNTGIVLGTGTVTSEILTFEICGGLYRDHLGNHQNLIALPIFKCFIFCTSIKNEINSIIELYLFPMRGMCIKLRHEKQCLKVSYRVSENT